LLDRSWYYHRAVAAQALGDTADPAALDPLVTALVDPDRRVRRTAADAVRRLSHTTSTEAVFDHPIRQKLEATLADKDKNVALAVACALVTIGDAASVQAYVANNPRSRRTFAGVLAGEIPPLFPIWPGEEAV
jgi:HEAT repeat protein